MTTEKQRLRKMDQAKTAKRKEQNQVRLTIETAENRKEWQDRWAELRSYAGKVAWSYCGRRLRQYTLDQIREVRDEALSEAWRHVCAGESAERAITMAVDLITQTRVNHINQSRPLGDIPEDRETFYLRSALRLRTVARQVPKRCRRLALLLITRNSPTDDELAIELGRTRRTVINYRREIRIALECLAFADFSHPVSN